MRAPLAPRGDKPQVAPIMIPSNQLDFSAEQVAALDTAFHRVLASRRFILDQEVRRFEETFAQFTGNRYCIGVANGTDALELALRAIGVRPGQKVLNVANAGGYASLAIQACGARPMYVEIDARSGLICTDALARVNEAVAAIIVTHLYGEPVDMAAVMDIAQARQWRVIEDCSQAHGARLGERMVGSFGDVATFSFYPTKNLGALGDGGAVVTSSDDVSERLRKLRQYGWTARYHFELGGGRNSRLDEMQAAFLLALMPSLDANNVRRQVIARRYRNEIAHADIRFPVTSDGAVSHLCVCLSAHRSSLRAHLHAHGIGSDVHYPEPDHWQPAMRAQQSLPSTERWCEQVLSLPCFPTLRDDQVSRIVGICNAWNRDT